MPSEMTDARKAWADAVYVERHRRRLKQAQLAETIGVDQSTISNAEAGNAAPETYRAIAKALEIELPEAGE